MFSDRGGRPNPAQETAVDFTLNDLDVLTDILKETISREEGGKSGLSIRQVVSLTSLIDKLREGGFEAHLTPEDLSLLKATLRSYDEWIAEKRSGLKETMSRVGIQSHIG